MSESKYLNIAYIFPFDHIYLNAIIQNICFKHLINASLKDKLINTINTI